MNRFAVLALLASGCLPAYDNAVGSPTPVDMAVGEGGDGDMAMVTGSGMFVTLKTTSIETEQNLGGPTGYFYGYPQFTSMPADATGNVKIEMPSTLIGVANAYVVLGGDRGGTPILKTLVAPPRYGMMAIGASSAPFIHYFEKTDDTGVRGQIGKELATASKITAADKIATDFSVGFGALVYVSSGLIRYSQFAVKVTENGIDSPAAATCDQANQCCAYYTTCTYPNWKNNLLGCGGGKSFLDLAATKSAGEFFAVVCPNKGAPEGTISGTVTLTQTQPTNTLIDSTGQPPPSDFPPFTLPKFPSDGVHIEWWITN